MSVDRNLRQVCEALYGAGGAASSTAPISEDGVTALAAVLRESARSLIVEAIDAELRHFRRQPGQPRLAREPRSVVRNGLHPERLIVTGIGRIPVRLPKLRSRNGAATDFRSAVVPRYARRARPSNAESTESYLRAIAAGDLGRALAALLGPQALAVPAPVTRALQAWWSEQCGVWRYGPPPRPGVSQEFWAHLAHGCSEAPPRNGRYGAYDAVARAVVGTPLADPVMEGNRRPYTKIDPPLPSIDSRSKEGAFGEGD